MDLAIKGVHNLPFLHNLTLHKTEILCCVCLNKGEGLDTCCSAAYIRVDSQSAAFYNLRSGS